MITKRTYEILKSIQDRQDIVISEAELGVLEQQRFISTIPEGEDPAALASQMQSLRENFSKMSEANRQAEKELFLAENTFAKLPGLVKATGKLGLGKGATMRKDIGRIKAKLEQEEKQLLAARNDLLTLNTVLEQQREAVRVDGHKVRLLQAGKSMIMEIATRPRFHEREIDDILKVTNDIDELFSKLLQSNESNIRANPGVSFWIPYLVNLESVDMAPSYRQLLAPPAYSYGDEDDEDYEYTPPDRREDLIIFPYHGTDLGMWKNLGANDLISSLLRTQLSIAYEAQTVGEFLDKLFSRTGQVPVGGPLGSMLAGSEQFIAGEYQQYATNLQRILASSAPGNLLNASSTGNSGVQGAGRFGKDEACAMLLLAFSRHPEQYPYFLNRLEAIPYGKEILAAMATLFPWDAEETWAVLLRAESHILSTQSAKFVPEVSQYAITLASNPGILIAENSITRDDLQRWIRYVIPAIQAVMAYVLEADISQFIQERPVSYVTSPQITSGHYHYHHHHFHFAHYHHVG